MNHLPRLLRSLCVGLLALVIGHSAVAATDGAPIPVLLIGGQNNHDWKTSNAFLMDLFGQHKEFAVVENNTPGGGTDDGAWAQWKPEFSKYRCVILNYNGAMWPENVRTEFEQYLNNGGGAIVLHAANNSFTGWKAFEQAVGLLWRPKEFGASVYYDDKDQLVREEAGQGRGMGHGGIYDWRMTVRDTTSPITAGMPSQWMHRWDELYHGQRGPAENLHILLSAYSQPDQGGTGKDEPIVWWVPVGKGKMLTNLMGHVGETACLSCIGYQTTLLRSIEWLATGACTIPIPTDFPTAHAASQYYPGGLIKSLKHDMTPEESLARFKLPPGYHIELVAKEPMIINPVALAWDGDGRMFVAEMRTYMTNPDGKHEFDPTSRVSMLTDSTGSGVLDKATIFVDHLVLPRMVLPLDDRVIIAETSTGRFDSYKDTKGDGIADDKKVVYDAHGAGGNLEHQDSALLYGTDNYLYTAQVGQRRFRINADSTWTAERMYGQSGQYGLAQDDMGRLICSAAGGENPCYGYQQHPSYGVLNMPGDRTANFDEVFPRMQIVDVQGGLGRVKPYMGTLNHITGCAGQSVFRGDRLPADLYGDYILPEPVGRMVRRAKINVVDGKRVMANAYENDEFITSTDPAFRPVWSATGPDGCLYIVDLHNGIVQESAWTQPGSYLRGIVDRDGHSAYIQHGRIYRVVYDGMKPGPRPQMRSKKPADLVQYLSSPNGWWRDTAQQLIVLRHDVSVGPALIALAQTGTSGIGRVHALWTLDGLGLATREVIVSAFGDSDARVRCTALRLCESLLKKGDTTLTAEMGKLATDKDVDVVIQLVDSLRYSQDLDAKTLLLDIASHNPGNAVIGVSAQQSVQYNPDNPGAPLNLSLKPADLLLARKGLDHFRQVCFACHGIDGKGVVTSDGMHIAPSLSNSPLLSGGKEGATRIVLHGLIGEIDGKTYNGLMLPMNTNDDQWLSEVLTYIRSAFGNSGDPVSKQEVAAIRAETSSRTTPYTMADLVSWVPVSQQVMHTWTFTASQNADKVGNAIDGNQSTRWDTGAGQVPGQYFQFDMTKPWAVTSLTINCKGSDGDYPRGWEVTTSMDGQTWSAAIAKGEGSNVSISIVLPAHTITRFIRITQTASGKTGNYWSIHEMTLNGAPAP